MLNVGGHVALGRDPQETVAELAAGGFGSMQIFASSPGAWKPPIKDAGRDDYFRKARRQHGVEPLFIHAIYLINLASEDSLLVKRSKASLVATLEGGASMGAAGVVTHIGSHGGRGFEAVAGDVASQLHAILNASPEHIDLLLENSAGAGNIIGSELEELAELIALAGYHPRLKVALDTAHLCGAGWDFSSSPAVDALVQRIETTFGWERLALIHANDSKTPSGSRRDRHANIGDGFIGLEGFRRLVHQPRLAALPWILETPNLERRVEERAALQALTASRTPLGVAHAS